MTLRYPTFDYPKNLVVDRKNQGASLLGARFMYWSEEASFDSLNAKFEVIIHNG